MDVKTDIDIDFFDRNKALEKIEYISAVELRDTERRKHLSGVYFHDIPVNPVDGMAAYEYQDAEKRGYFKVDFLNNSIYKDVRDEKHLVELLVTEPPWEIFQDKDIVQAIAQVGNRFDVVSSIQPSNVDDLAVCIALIRPGKAHLIGKPRHVIDAEIWKKTDGYYFKKSHAYAYALAIVVQMNLLVEKAYG